MSGNGAPEGPIYEVGFIHGRFQILHMDHMKYLLAGKALCRHLVVGITNPDPTLIREDTSDPNRSCGEANPLTYYERQVLIQESLTEAGIDCREFTIVPFPVNLPELYFCYVPKDAVFFVSIYDDWGRKKRDTFIRLGLRTHVLWEVAPEQKGLSGSDIRRAIVKNQPWEHLVPPVVARLLKRWNLSGRLQSLRV
ncbi:MAG: nicotinate-nucleotide adenylyltransferase [Syntrophales bacterium]|jgi:nicotinamide-nucleotide adenylyltransferase|nr:nicotinate-nucleotide adenylyltransferase [Syntrophales bacterium]